MAQWYPWGPVARSENIQAQKKWGRAWGGRYPQGIPYIDWMNLQEIPESSVTAEARQRLLVDIPQYIPWGSSFAEGAARARALIPSDSIVPYKRDVAKIQYFYDPRVKRLMVRVWFIDYMKDPWSPKSFTWDDTKPTAWNLCKKELAETFRGVMGRPNNKPSGTPWLPAGTESFRYGNPILDRVLETMNQGMLAQRAKEFEPDMSLPPDPFWIDGVPACTHPTARGLAPTIQAGKE